MTMKRRTSGQTRTQAVRSLATRTHRAGTLALALGLGGAGLASATVTPAGNGLLTSAKASLRHHNWSEIGRASWYGGKFHGRRTALGDRFDMNAMTCAHRTLPLGSWVKVTNLHNKRSVFLRVNDRGPMSESLIVDLSMAAAHTLGISGLGSVKLESVSHAAVLADRAAHQHTVQRVQPPMLEMASNEYGVPILPPSIADR